MYWMIGLNSDIGKFFMCCLIVVLCAQTSVSFGHFVSAASPTVTVATTVAGPFLGLFMLFGGFFLNNSYVFIKYFYIF
jgi:ATP-binding cassette, subfamily G (WHITE), eye pigment precursor transporter